MSGIDSYFSSGFLILVFFILIFLPIPIHLLKYKNFTNWHPIKASSNNIFPKFKINLFKIDLPKPKSIPVKAFLT